MKSDLCWARLSYIGEKLGIIRFLLLTLDGLFCPFILISKIVLVRPLKTPYFDVIGKSDICKSIVYAWGL